MNDSPALRPPLDRSRLNALASDWRVEIVEQAASTNAVVAERARAGEQPGLVVVAEHQTSGRGRLDRVWETPARAALTVSFLVDPQVPPAQWPLLPLLVGYVVESTISDRVPHASLKWPNDVMALGPDGWGRKLAGILVERVEGPHGPVAVVGIGLNVSQSSEELPVETATSLRLEVEADIAFEREADAEHLGQGDDCEESGIETVIIDRTELLTSLLTNWLALKPLLDQPDTLVAAYASVCATLGQEVDVHLPGGTVHRGMALGLEASGALVVADETAGSGGTLTVSAGDVVHVRPAG